MQMNQPIKFYYPGFYMISYLILVVSFLNKFEALRDKIKDGS